MWPNESGLRFVKVSAGSSVQRVVYEQDGALLEPGGNCPPGQECLPPPISEPAALTAAATAPEAGPAPREDAAVVVSSRRESIWVLGGRRLSDGQLLHDAWEYQLGTGRWREVSLSGGALGRVLAGTYAPLEGALYVLDEVDGRGMRREARLVRVEVTAPSVDVVARWPRVASTEAFALSAAPTGELWVAASGPRSRHHVVGQLVPDMSGALHLDGWTSAPGRMLGQAARAEAMGLSLLVEHRGEVLALGHTAEELLSTPGGERRCLSPGRR